MGAISSASSGLGEFACGVLRTQIVFTVASHGRASHRHVPQGLHLIGIEFMGMRLVHASQGHAPGRGSHRHVLVLVPYPAPATPRAA
jgi:hypothetical protein